MRGVLLACLILAACGSGGGDESHEATASSNHGYGDHFDALSANGMKLRFTPALAVGHPLALTSFYEEVFAVVSLCAGISAPVPPFIIFLAEGGLGTQDEGSRGRYFGSPPLIVIAGNTFALPHEMVHYLLHFSTGNADPGHASPLFQRCGSIPL